MSAGLSVILLRLGILSVLKIKPSQIYGILLDGGSVCDQETNVNLCPSNVSGEMLHIFLLSLVENWMNGDKKHHEIKTSGSHQAYHKPDGYLKSLFHGVFLFLKFNKNVSLSPTEVTGSYLYPSCAQIMPPPKCVDCSVFPADVTSGILFWSLVAHFTIFTRQLCCG